MGTLTLLQLVNQAQSGLGISQSSSIIGNIDLFAAQFLSFANRVGGEVRDHPEGGWTYLQNEADLKINTAIATTGNITLNSPIITNIAPNTTNLLANFMSISGNAIPVSSRIKTVDSSSQVTMTMSATGNATSEPISFGQDTYPVPSDFKAFINRTWWDRTNHWELFGPASPQMDQWHKSGIVATGPRRWFRIVGNKANTFQIWPPPFELVNPVQFAYEYFSNNWVNSTGAGITFLNAFAADTDTTLFDDDLFILGLQWKFLQNKGMGYDVQRNDFIDRLKLMAARDGGSETLYMAKRVHSQFLSPSQVIDGNYPGPLTST